MRAQVTQSLKTPKAEIGDPTFEDALAVLALLRRRSVMGPVFVVCTGGTATSPIVVMGRVKGWVRSGGRCIISVYIFSMDAHDEEFYNRTDI